MSLKLRIALRYLFARKSHAAVNIISMVSVAGIALATAALVVVMSVFNGFHSLMESRLSVLEPPVSAVPAQGKDFAGADALCAALEQSPAIERALPVVQERALAVCGQRQTVVRLYGVPPELYGQFDAVSVAGEPWADYYPGVEPAVLSVGVVNRLQVPIGREETVGLYVPRRKGRINPSNPQSAFRTDSVAPSAAFALNQQEVDADVMYAPISTVSRLLQYDDQATDIYIYPTGSVDAAVKAAESTLGADARVMTLEQRRSSMFRIVNIEKWVTFMLLGFIMLIASFNVISSLSLLIIEKEQNAATLMALGATRRDVRGVYRIEGLLITGFGTILGAILGTLLSLGQQFYRWIKLSADSEALSIEAYPVEFHVVDLIYVVALAAIIGAVTSAIATRKA